MNLIFRGKEKRRLKELLHQQTHLQREAAKVLTDLHLGNYSSSVSPAFAETELGKATESIKSHLTSISQVEAERNWLNVGLAKFSDVLRNKDGLSLADLANDILINVVKYLEANQGAVFLLDGEETDQYLDLIACYAFDRKKHLTKRINLGEGLAGQCVLEKDIIYLKKTPSDFARITSGLGGATPREVLISPLLVNDTVYGVIELASFIPFSEHKIQFIKKLSENIAATIKTVRENEKVISLLKASQHQTEALRAQEEELRQNMEELEATQEEMQRKTIEISRSSAEMMSVMKGIDMTMATIEFTPDGTILDANANFLRTVGFSADQIKGRHHRMFVHDDVINSEEYQTFWKKLSSGESLKGVFKRRSSTGKTIWLNAIYTPILDHHDKVIKVVKFATDITAEQEMLAETKGVMEGVDATMAVISFNPSGNVITANGNFLSAMGYTIEQVRERHHRMFVPGDIQSGSEYETFWSRLSEGESLKGTFKRIASDGRTVWLNAIYNPIRNADGKVVKVVKFATIVADPNVNQ